MLLTVSRSTTPVDERLRDAVVKPMTRPPTKLEIGTRKPPPYLTFTKEEEAAARERAIRWGRIKFAQKMKPIVADDASPAAPVLKWMPREFE